MAALAPTGLPVPRMIGLCDDADVIGSDFYVMDYVRGRSFWDQRLPGLEASEKKAIYAAMVSTLARLHRVDPAAVGLADRSEARRVGKVCVRTGRSRWCPSISKTINITKINT